jgi:hypothetical protein
MIAINLYSCVWGIAEGKGDEMISELVQIYNLRKR